MICDVIPADIQNLIVSLWNEKYPDEESKKLLPPQFVRDMVLTEKGITAPRGAAQQELTRDWLAKQKVAQDEAMKIQESLQKTEPMTEELARQGQLPAWVVKPWAVTLMFQWSSELPDAVIKAQEYLDEAMQSTPSGK
jgi:hypothetical protein